MCLLLLQLTGERAEALCAARRGAAGFEAHVAHLCSGPLWVLLLAGPGTLQKWLQMMGPPDPSEARVKAPKRRARDGFFFIYI